MSRNKGRRGEYLVRDHLKACGYDAVRVPLSGASQGFKGDVIAYIPGKEELTFEVKLRKNTFQRIYKFYDFMTRDKPFRFTPREPDPKLAYAASMSKHPVDLITETDDTTYRLLTEPEMKEHKRAIRQIGKLRELVKDADILVIKDDHKPLLYIRYV